jgi:hypothetical protein
MTFSDPDAIQFSRCPLSGPLPLCGRARARRLITVEFGSLSFREALKGLGRGQPTTAEADGFQAHYFAGRDADTFQNPAQNAAQGDRTTATPGWK